MRCKVGDLVMVVGRDKRPDTNNLGRFGTVTEPIGDGYIASGNNDWWVKPQNTFNALLNHEPRIFGETVQEVSFKDHELQPIPPETPVEDTETAREKEHSWSK